MEKTGSPSNTFNLLKRTQHRDSLPPPQLVVTHGPPADPQAQKDRGMQCLAVLEKLKRTLSDQVRRCLSVCRCVLFCKRAAPPLHQHAAVRVAALYQLLAPCVLY